MTTFGINPADAPPKLLHNLTSGTATSVTVSSTPGAKTLSGALTANTYKKMIDVTGAGRIDYLAVYVGDTTSRTLGLKLVIDGVDVCDSVTGAITSLGHGKVAVASSLEQGPLFYANSFQVWIKSSLSETDKCTLAINYVEV